MNDSKGEQIQDTVSEFIKHYGVSGLKEALQIYSEMQQEYICKNKSSIHKLKIYDIYYLEIREHTIYIHTEYGTYQKYGTLKNELKHLSHYGFMKCNQSCIVSMQKIQTLQNNEVILVNHEHLYMSRHYAPTVLMAFSRYQN